MNRFKQLVRRLRTMLWTALTLITLLAAVLVGVGKLLMPYSVQYKPQLEAWLSSEFKQDVRIDSFTGEWKAFGPRISLEGLNLQGGEPGANVIAIQHAALDIKPLNVLISGRPLYTFRIIGADLAIVRTPDGQFEVSGFGVTGRGDGSGTEGESPFNNLARLGEVRLEQASISFDDDERDIDVQLIEVNGVLQMDDRRLAMEVEASVSDERRFRVLGDVGATILVTLDRQQRLKDARWHVKTGELMISDFGQQLPEHELKPLSGWLNAELWGSWAPGEAQVMEGVLDIREVSLESQPANLQLDHLNSRFKWRWHDRKTWRIDLADVQVDEGGRQWESELITVERNIPGGLGVWVSADYVQAEFPMQVTQRVMSSFNARWPKAVPKQGKGEIRNFHILINSDKQLASAGGEFENLSVTDWGRFPRIDGVSGDADLAFGEGEIRFSGQGVVVDWQQNFRQPAVVDVPGCKLEILWAERGKNWQVDARQCQAENDAIHVSGRTRFAASEGKPVMDINVKIHRANLDALDDYWPESIMKPKVTDWLRRGLVAGEVSDGRFILSGDLDDWPFRHGEGTLEARVVAGDATIDYYPGWPAATGVQATAMFRGVSMDVSGSIASIGGASVDQIRARIDDFQAARLDLDYDTGTELPALVDFIDASPLLDNTRLDLSQFEFSAAARTRGQLRVPLTGEGETLSIDGELSLDGNGFRMAESGQQLDEITGTIRYTQDGFNGAGLDSLFSGWPTVLDIEADWDAQEVFGARLQGNYPASLIVGQSTLGDDPLLARITGASDWDIRLSVSGVPEQDENEIWLHMQSGLEGVVMDLPLPLRKAPEVTWPVTLRYPIQARDQIFTADLNERMVIQVETSTGLSGPVRASVHLGGEVGALPAAGYFNVGGSAERFDLDEWMDVVIDYFEAQRYPGSLTFRDASLRAGELILLDRVFNDVSLDVVYEDQVLSTEFDGEAIAGVVRYHQSGDTAHSLTAELERLRLPDPVNKGMEMDTDPADLPEMHLYVKQFSYLGMDLGETRIEAFPQGDGLRIESVEAVSPQMNFQARGDWIHNEDGSRSDFDIVLTSESLGSLVSAMDLSSVLEGGQTMVRYDAWWPGPPAAFALAVLNGEMQFSVIDGRILTADPGAGRVLGLISVTALPRRLALDFRDVFESGFSFDQASGTIQLENGSAHTNDFVMESTAASLSIVGQSDLVDQQFDYQMTVRPGVSQALPVIGAIAGGPGGAAAGLALQGLLRQALGDATEARYAITGAWSEPEVVRLETAARNESEGGDPTDTEGAGSK